MMDGSEEKTEKGDKIVLLEDVDFTDFWNRWESATLIERNDQIRKLVNQNLRYMLVENAKFSTEREERLFLMALTTLLNSYFEDLYAFMVKKFSDAIISAKEIATDEIKQEELDGKESLGEEGKE